MRDCGEGHLSRTTGKLYRAGTGDRAKWKVTIERGKGPFLTNVLEKAAKQANDDAR